MEFSYFQEHESEQFTFFRIPKILFSDERFAGLSSEAKILYGLMLDRVGLSRKNGWIDQNGNVYIQSDMITVLLLFHLELTILISPELRSTFIRFNVLLSCGRNPQV